MESPPVAFCAVITSVVAADVSMAPVVIADDARAVAPDTKAPPCELVAARFWICPSNKYRAWLAMLVAVQKSVPPMPPRRIRIVFAFALFVCDTCAL